MKLEDLRNNFKKYNNTNVVINIDQKNKEFIVASNVDVSGMEKPQKELINSYDPLVLQNLSDKLTNYLDEFFVEDGSSYEYNKKIYEIDKLDTTDQKKKENFRRVYYYVSFNSPLTRKNENNFITNQFEKIIINDGLAQLDFEPQKSDENIIIEKSFSPYDDNSKLNTNFNKTKFGSWYFCVFKPKIAEDPFLQGLQNILQLLGKKGSWVTAPPENKNIVEGLTIENINIEIDSNIDADKKTFLLEEFELQLSQTSHFKQKSFETNNIPERNLLIHESLSQFSIAVFYKEFKDETGETKYLVGFTKATIDVFPNLDPATDLQEIKITNTVEFSNLSDLQKTIEILKQTIDKKLSGLNEQGIEIDNYDVEEYTKNIEIFVAEINKNIEKQKIDKDFPLVFEFARSKCIKPQLNVNNPILEAEFKECEKRFVEGQTNLFLKNVLYKNSGTDVVINNISSAQIDNTISSYLFANCKQIIELKNSYMPKDFFTNLVYKKTKYEKRENVSLSVFYDTAKRSFQQSFVTDLKNVVVFSRIKENIIKSNFKNKTIGQNIRDILSDINSLKQIYNSILYRYDLKDLADELLACYSKNFQLNNPAIAEFITLSKEFLTNLINVLNTEDKNFNKFAECLGFPIPANLANLPGKAISDPKDYLKEQLQNTTFLLLNTFADADNFTAQAIKCVDIYFEGSDDEKLAALISSYKDSKLTAKLVKEQYEQLKLQAKTYRQNPGVKESLARKKSRNRFIKKALRNAWILLQKQAEREAERILTEKAVEIIKNLLADLNNCKPTNSKDKNTNNAIGAAGALSLNFVTDDEVSKLLNYLSEIYDPEKLCSLFYGSANDDLYSSILQIIKNKFTVLYSSEPIKYKNVVISKDSLSTLYDVKNFFIVLSTEFPSLTSQKCDSYFENLSKTPLEINYDEKCIDFTPKYRENKINDLTRRGFTQKQAEDIVNAQSKSQIDKYNDLLKKSESGIYNELNKGLDETEYPVENIVKEKVQKQLISLNNSISSFINSYKKQLSSASSLEKVEILQENYPIFEAYAYNINKLTLKGISIDYVQPSAKEETPMSILISPSYYYTIAKPFLPYVVEIFNPYYFVQQKDENLDLLTSVQQLISSDLVSKKLFTNSLFKIVDPEKHFKVNENSIVTKSQERFYWVEPVKLSIFDITKDILQNYKQQNNDFVQKAFSSSLILEDVKELIYFEEE